MCDSGYTGQYCNSLIDYCADDPCDDGATCYRGVYSYYCRCESNVTGCVESGQPSAVSYALLGRWIGMLFDTT